MESTFSHCFLDPHDPFIAETFLPAAIYQKIPVNLVICFLKVNFQHHTLFLFAFGFPHHFLQQHYTIGNKPPFYKSILTWVYQLTHDRFHPYSHSFCEDFE
jgi:hypothetical protein